MIQSVIKIGAHMVEVGTDEIQNERDQVGRSTGQRWGSVLVVKRHNIKGSIVTCCV